MTEDAWEVKAKVFEYLGPLPVDKTVEIDINKDNSVSSGGTYAITVRLYRDGLHKVPLQFQRVEDKIPTLKEAEEKAKEYMNKKTVCKFLNRQNFLGYTE